MFPDNLKITYFQVLWKLCPTGIAWVHRYEVTNGRVHWNVNIHELKPFLLLPDGILNALHLELVLKEASR